MSDKPSLSASAVLVWVEKGESPTDEAFNPKNLQPPPAANPEAWWQFGDAVVYAIETQPLANHNKEPWIKTGDAFFDPDDIKRVYNVIKGKQRTSS